ncbi:hypothetical protein BpHYR1_030779 [Brachionus plicatilis]|uniref:Uncharacterized protein n=1 Tax=Brachionus plicatilis TaxID=10195 RepID=A0A3M7RJR3_BRAPC|nr:hypothetical protein BpHYR1_030779 [Brachionus plicatilis]
MNQIIKINLLIGIFFNLRKFTLNRHGLAVLQQINTHNSIKSSHYSRLMSYRPIIQSANNYYLMQKAHKMFCILSTAYMKKITSNIEYSVFIVLKFYSFCKKYNASNISKNHYLPEKVFPVLNIFNRKSDKKNTWIKYNDGIIKKSDGTTFFYPNGQCDGRGVLTHKYK